jgi:hypothetical protein
VEKSLPGCLLFASFLFAGMTLPAQEIPRASLPSGMYRANDKGIIMVEVAYGLDGKVENARIVRSNVPFSLESSVIDTIRKQWQVPLFAGAAMTFPIYFDTPPAAAGAWNEDTPPPRDLLPPGDAGRTLKVQVYFGDDGWVVNERIVEPSGIQLLDTETEIWIKVHWHHAAFANGNRIFPIEFLPQNAPSTSPASVPLLASHPAGSSGRAGLAKQKPSKPAKKHSPLAEAIDTEADEAQPAVKAQ